MNRAPYVSCDAVREALARALPDARVEEATAIGRGWNAIAYRVPAPSGDYVVRIPLLEWAAGEIERQSCLMPRLLEHGLPVVEQAAVLRDEAGTVICGVHRYAPGTSAERRSNRGRRRALLARAIAEFVSRLHAVPADVFLACGAARSAPWTDHYRHIAMRATSDAGPAGAEWLRRIGERLEALGADGVERVPVHGDLQPAHVLLGEGGDLRAVLDFSGPLITDPAYEFSRIVQHYGDRFAEQVLASYRGPVDAGLPERMRLYDALRPAVLLEVGRARDLPEARRRALRQIAARAAAWGRVQRRRGTP